MNVNRWRGSLRDLGGQYVLRLARVLDIPIFSGIYRNHATLAPLTGV